MVEDVVPDFRAKTVCFYLSSPGPATSEGVVLVDPKFVRMHGRLFLEGNAPEDWGWYSGCPCAVAWDSVQHYVTLDSEEAKKTFKGGFWSRVSGT